MITIHFQMGNAGCFRKEPKDSLSFFVCLSFGKNYVFFTVYI